MSALSVSTATRLSGGAPVLLRCAAKRARWYALGNASVNIAMLTLGDMPYFFYEDADGDQVALPCTERLLNVDLAAHVTAQGFLPVLAIKGKPEVRLGSFQSLTGKPLWNFHSGGRVSSNPISFNIDGRQHMAVAADKVLYVFGL